MKPVAFILLMSLTGWVTAQHETREDDHCKVHNKMMCSSRNCLLRGNHISNCCEYKKPYSRLLGGKQYTLLNPCEDILLYKQEVRVNKWVTYSYFFSKDIDSPLVKLTKDNLQLAYPDDREFQKKLDELFTSDRELSRFDGLYNMYLLNWLYAKVKE